MVEHVGRGGDVLCRCAAGELRLPIEMASNGQFSVGLRGVRLGRLDGSSRRLRSDEREQVSAQLRSWLDANDRAGWVIER